MDIKKESLKIMSFPYFKIKRTRFNICAGIQRKIFFSNTSVLSFYWWVFVIWSWMYMTEKWAQIKDE